LAKKKVKKKTDKKTVALTTVRLSVILFSVLQSVNLAEANPARVYSFEMPEEYLNYTISRDNGSF
jgi:hypothetical protein